MTDPQGQPDLTGGTQPEPAGTGKDAHRPGAGKSVLLVALAFSFVAGEVGCTS